MKKIITILAVLCAAALTSCGMYFPHVTGSGNIVTTTYAFVGITKVKVGGQFVATVQYGDTAMVEITADDNLIRDNIGIFRDGNEIIVTLDPTCWYSNIHVQANITLPLLEEVTAAENAQVTVLNTTGFFPASMTVNTSENAILYATLNTNDLTVNASGNSTPTLTFIGTVSNLNAVIKDNAQVKQSGSLTWVDVTGSANAKFDIGASSINTILVDLSDNCEVDIKYATNGYGTLSDNAKLYYSDNIVYRNFTTSDNAKVEYKWDLGL